ncbi:MAG TPA: hypothetical protein DCL54_15900, partial [Alphaproteobacteria bacterium]|nr:hypothetical protein [Alphaproteobacteria bacterium]
MNNDTDINLPALDPQDPPADAMVDQDQRRTAADLEAMFDVPVNVSAVLGKASMEVSTLLKLGRGAVVEPVHRNVVARRGEATRGRRPDPLL